MTYEYKAIGAPEKGVKKKGAKTASDRAAAAFQAILEAQAAAGWEYLRTDLVPVEEKAGLFSKPQRQHRGVMIFRREKAKAEEPVRMGPRQQRRTADDEPVVLTPPKRPLRGEEPAVEEPELRLARPVEEPEIRLAHSADAPRRRGD